MADCICDFFTALNEFCGRNMGPTFNLLMSQILFWALGFPMWHNHGYTAESPPFFTEKAGVIDTDSMVRVWRQSSIRLPIHIPGRRFPRRVATPRPVPSAGRLFCAKNKVPSPRHLVGAPHTSEPTPLFFTHGFVFWMPNAPPHVSLVAAEHHEQGLVRDRERAEGLRHTLLCYVLLSSLPPCTAH